MEKRMGKCRKNGYDKFSREENFDFSIRSSVGIGGKAKDVFCPQSLDECVELLRKLQEEKREFCVLGNLTNVLPPDEDIDKAVLLTKGLRNLKKTKTGVFACAGVHSGALLRFCKQNGYGGVEFLQGVPCSVGGAVFMNAGVRGRYISEIVDEILVYRDGKTLTLSNAECQYSYKKSAFMQNQDVILGASLRLTKATVDEITAKEREYACKRAHLPKGKSMGCVFKNPQGYSAGQLIEDSGFKGFREGGAIVAEEHANFIINDSGATSRDVEILIEKIKTAVFAKFGVRLEEEIRRI